MSKDILRLRVCRSEKAGDFLRAMEYYSLWDVTSNAKSVLGKEARREEKMGRSKSKKQRKKGLGEQHDVLANDYVGMV